MISRKHFPLVEAVLYSIIMGTVMTLVMTCVFVGHIPWPDIMLSIGIAVVSTFLAGMLFPAGRLGQDMAVRFGAKAGSARFVLMAAIIPGVYFTLVQTAIATLRMTGFTAAFWP